MMGNLIGGILIVIVLVCLMFGALAGAGNRAVPRRRQSQRPHLRGGKLPHPGGEEKLTRILGQATRQTCGSWQAPRPRPQSHPYQDNLKKNQGGWRWQ
jgi:hypothetical protein